MNVTYVSALYNIYDTDTVSNRLAQDVQNLLKQDIKLILYVDEFFFNVVKNMELTPKIIIIKFSVCNLEIYSKIIAKKESLKLAEVRNVDKDTCEYMALMNSKVEFIFKSTYLITTPYVGWIDAGISKIFKTNETFSKICNLNIGDLDNIVIPGRFNIPVSSENLNKGVWWNFLGGFFICNKNIIPRFYTSALDTINDSLKSGHIVWEVNLWSYMDSNSKEKLFDWYYGEFDDSIFNVPSSYLSGIEKMKSKAKVLRLKGENQSSYDLCKKILEIEKDPFSIVNEELSIVSYYTGKKEEGRIASERVLASKFSTSATKALTLSNIIFYLISLNGTFKEIPFSLPATLHQYFPSTASLLKYENKYLCNIRLLNYSIRSDGSYDVQDPQNIVRTKNFILSLDQSFNIISSYELSDDISLLEPRCSSRIVGLEDVRIFMDCNNNKYFFATSCETLPFFCPRIVFGSWDDNGKLLFLKALKIPDSLNNSCEKNWLPFVTDDNEIHFIYTTSPLTIYKIDRQTFEISLVSKISQDIFADYEFRGSSSLIPYTLNEKNGWLCTIHQVLYSSPRKYYHRFVWYSKDFSSRKYGQLFYFEKIGIEYNLSICKSFDEEKLLLTYSVSDNSSKIFTMTIQDVNKHLEFSDYLLNNYIDDITNSNEEIETNKKTETVELMKDIITDVVKDMSKISNNNNLNYKGSKKICLCMIVKNESKIIQRCLESCKPILDYISICDTGSTDNTIEIINNFCKENNIIGKVHNHVWKNFGHNRTLSYVTAKETFPDADYCLLIDADMSLKILPGFNKSSLDAGGYLVAQQGGSLYYFNTRLLGMKFNWRCVGVTHEYWSAENPLCVSKQLTTLEMDDFGDGGAKADKFERDIRLLTQGLIDEPKNERYMFYLAQSYHDTGQYGNAIKWYRKRIAMGGWFEEVYYSYYRIARCKLGMKRSWGEIQQAYEEAHKYLPSRMEPVFEIGKYYQENEKYPEAYKWLTKASKIPFPSDQVLFLFKDIYEFRVWDALGIAAFYVGQYQEGINACIKALKSSFCTHERERIKDNMRFSLEKLKK